MTKKLIYRYIGVICMAVAALLNTSCEKFEAQTPEQEHRTFILFSMGFNNLSGALKSDIDDLVKHSLSKDHKNCNLLVFSHHTSGGSTYSIPTSPVLTHIYKDDADNIVRDTLLVMSPNTISPSAETVRTVLEFVQENFKSDKYGMLVSSHGTGWAPENYCNYPDRYDNVPGSSIWKVSEKDHGIPAPLMDGTPDVKSIGVHNTSKSEVIEMDITDLAEAIPMKMDYIIFDACFMGCVEVAYELREKCGMMVSSQTEILADGMDYKTMLSYLFNPAGTDLKGFCENYYQYYNKGSEKSATISLIDCSRLEPLTLACKDIFEKYGDRIRSLITEALPIQRYYRTAYAKNHGWFYDLESIMINSGATKDELDLLNTTLRYCVKYKAATEKFMGNIELKHHSGLSMYLPYENRTYLNDFYKTLKWNQDTGLVQ